MTLTRQDGERLELGRITLHAKAVLFCLACFGAVALFVTAVAQGWITR